MILCATSCWDSSRERLMQAPRWKTRPSCKLAAGSSRILLGALADQLKDQQENRINPVKLLRNLRTYHLLQGLAERTLEDHWFDPDGKGETTYYGPAAGAYLDSAAKLLKKPKDESLLRKRVDLVNRLKKTGLKIAKADLKSRKPTIRSGRPKNRLF